MSLWGDLFECCGWCCDGELGDESDFRLSLGVGPVVCRVRVRFFDLRLPARKILDIGGRRKVWAASDPLTWVSLEAVCVGEGGGVFWLGVLVSFARGDGGRVFMSIFRVCFCGVSR